MLKINNLKLLNERVINLDAHAGEAILVKGANGVGKSLFLKTLARLLPNLGGEIQFEDSDSLKMASDLWRSKILYLPPEVSFSDDLSVDDFLNEPFQLARYKHFKSTFNPRDFISNLESPMSLLSSGQRQRMAILRALSLNASILLLDESLSHMDPNVRAEMMGFLKEWKSNSKILFLVSHFELGSSHFDTRDFLI
jgi:ABC-type bacteriocin/lantibiotic exporter with double-glycine peptidase domain